MKYFGSSGIRAVFHQDLLTLAFRVGLAVGGRSRSVVVGRDTRTSGDAMKHAVISGLLAAGAECCDAGVVPTPTLAFAARDFEAGVMLTASHNPPEYNGIKLLNPDGASFDAAQQAEIEEKLAEASLPAAAWGDVKPCRADDGAVERHIAGIMSRFPHKKLKLKVVVDAGGGAASLVTPRLLKELGIEVVSLNCTPTGFFPRAVEPTEDNLEALKKAVKDAKADFGIAHDGDADRLMAVDELGRYISGDKLLAILGHALKAEEVVTTLDASMVIDEMKWRVRRTRIGDTYVSEALQKGGDFGGETSGAWIFPGLSLCPDGIYAAAQLASIASRQKLSVVADSVPVYPLRRGSVPGDGAAMKQIESGLMALAPLVVSRLDGLKLGFADGWLLVRPSGTEPKIRLTAEARSEARAGQLYDKALRIIEDSVETGVKAG
jgi:phosphoglucosamine mutase